MCLKTIKNRREHIKYKSVHENHFPLDGVLVYSIEFLVYLVLSKHDQLFF